MRYGLAPVTVGTAFALRQLLVYLLGSPLPPYILFFPAVMLVALAAGRGPGLGATLLAAVATQYWILQPVGDWRVAAPADVVGLGLFSGMGVLMSAVAGLYRQMRDRLEELVTTRTATLTQTNEQLQREMTERVRVGESLRESEQRLQTALRGGRMGIWELDLQTNLSIWDRTGYELFGLPPDDGPVPTDVFLRHVHPEDRPALERRLAEALEAGSEWSHECRIIREDGQVRWLATAGQFLRDAEGRPVQVIGVSYDISERKQAEEELSAAKESAELANRTKDHFLAVLSHELRTPLTPVVMGVAMLQGQAGLEPQLRETLEMVRRNVEMEARLIDDLLDVTGIARGKIELSRSPVDICRVVQQALEVCRPDLEARRLDFGVDLEPARRCWVDADAARLQQVIWNLLKNAIKFTPHGGCVGIRCRPENGHLVIEVADSGIGIEPEALPRIFKPFEQEELATTRRFGGLGLGLTISKALVEMHGGTIEAHSEGRNKGATFRIRLPRIANPVQPEPIGRERPGQPGTRALHILLVEDHGVTAQMIQMVLTMAGHTVEVAGDVATALEVAAQQSFDLLVSDLGLPDGSGHDLLRELRGRGYQYPAIALSGYGQEDDVHHSQEVGFAAHLTKPASPEALLEAIAEAVPK